MKTVPCSSLPLNVTHRYHRHGNTTHRVYLPQTGYCQTLHNWVAYCFMNALLSLNVAQLFHHFQHILQCVGDMFQTEIPHLCHAAKTEGAHFMLNNILKGKFWIFECYKVVSSSIFPVVDTGIFVLYKHTLVLHHSEQWKCCFRTFTTLPGLHWIYTQNLLVIYTGNVVMKSCKTTDHPE